MSSQPLVPWMQWSGQRVVVCSSEFSGLEASGLRIVCLDVKGSAPGCCEAKEQWFEGW